MAVCAYCKADAQLFEGDVPVCVVCVERRESNRTALEMDKLVRVTLIRDLVAAHARIDTASADRRNPRGESTAARKEIMKAHSRLNAFLSHGIVPEDLKRSG
jgi:hypothetical protein